LPYEGQRSIKGISFYVDKRDGRRYLVGTYRDKSGFGAMFWIRITDESPLALTWAAEYLNRKYRSH
jgi:hypothetical protein